MKVHLRSREGSFKPPPKFASVDGSKSERRLEPTIDRELAVGQQCNEYVVVGAGEVAVTTGQPANETQSEATTPIRTLRRCAMVETNSHTATTNPPAAS